MLRNLRELWNYRNLVRALVGRHLNARYRGSVLGFLWSFLNPLCLIAVYSFVFQFYIRFDDVEHYTLFLFTGLLPWIWFSSGLLEAAGSISGGGSLITKAMFPPHILPLVSVLTNLVNFLLSVPLLIGFMLITGVMPTASLAFLPVIIAIELIFLVGLSLLVAAMNVRYRDVQHILGNFITLWFFLCPILYPVDNIPEAFRVTLLVNPIGMLTEMYQQVFLYGGFPNFGMLMYTFGIAVLMFYVGNRVFNSYREEFAELV